MEQAIQSMLARYGNDLTRLLDMLWELQWQHGRVAIATPTACRAGA